MHAEMSPPIRNQRWKRRLCDKDASFSIFVLIHAAATAAATAAVVVVPGGCGVPSFNGASACTDEFVYGVRVRVMDVETGEPVSGASVVLTEGGFVESLREIDTGQYVGAGERAGVYELSVEAQRFERVTITAIEVVSGGCHVLPVEVSVSMASIAESR